MKEQGIVIEITDSEATIRINAHEACTKCCSCKGKDDQTITISGKKREGLNVGDNVEVDIEEGSMLRVYSLLYAVPLVVFVVAILTLYSVLSSPILSFMGAIAFVVVTYFIVSRYIKKLSDLAPNIRKML